MPAQKTTSNVSSKYADAMNAAMERNKSTPYKSGVINLPPGIKRGIAKLEECYFGSNENGDFWRASGTVDYPDSVMVDGKAVPVYGLSTSVVVSITEENKDDAFDRITNHMKGLAGDSILKDNPGVSLESLCQLLADTAKPGNRHIYFNFSTTETPEKKDKDGKVLYQARTWENWLGNKGLENYEPSKRGATDPGMVKDATKPSSNGAATTKAESQTQYRDDNDLASLGKRGDNGDLEAIETLKEYAARVGIDDDEVKATDSWKELAVRISRTGKDSKKSTSEPEEEPFIPDVKAIYGLMVKGKKVKVRVDSVNKAASTCTLKNLETKGTLKDIPFDSLVDGD